MFQTTNQLVYGRYIYTDWWYTYPSEKLNSMGRFIPYIVENKHVPNHQPAGLWYTDWWYTYPSENMTVNGKDYPIYYGE